MTLHGLTMHANKDKPTRHGSRPAKVVARWEGIGRAQSRELLESGFRARVSVRTKTVG
mgnify:CR=1 FL=1